MRVGSRIKVKPFKVPTMFGRMEVNEHALKLGTVLAIGDPNYGTLAVKVKLDGDDAFVYWFMMGCLEVYEPRQRQQRRAAH